ncbi:unnamed protein product [Amoebophrya sp. A25]|nr:unnamed protein product [Amoebophrya sp. A25]|eukprot:GSA25T00004012001.1
MKSRLQLLKKQDWRRKSAKRNVKKPRGPSRVSLGLCSVALVEVDPMRHQNHQLQVPDSPEQRLETPMLTIAAEAKLGVEHYSHKRLGSKIHPPHQEARILMSPLRQLSLC